MDVIAPDTPAKRSDDIRVVARRKAFLPQLGIKTLTPGDDMDVFAPTPANQSDDIIVVVRR